MNTIIPKTINNGFKLSLLSSFDVFTVGLGVVCTLVTLGVGDEVYIDVTVGVAARLTAGVDAIFSDGVVVVGCSNYGDLLDNNGHPSNEFII
jgi:hypothetical protein